MMIAIFVVLCLILLALALGRTGFWAFMLTIAVSAVLLYALGSIASM